MMENKEILPQIDHVVMVMMENRSLDNLLGWLYEEAQPNRFIPKVKTIIPYKGLQVGKHSNPYKEAFKSVKNYPVIKGTGNDGFDVPNRDPWEDFPNVMAQMFGDAEHQSTSPPPKGTVPKMLGFLQNFSASYESWDSMLQIMKTYSIEQTPMINGLAQLGAVSDEWYSSLPSQTNPNRAFSLCGTSLGRTSNLHYSAVEQFKAKTIWNALHDHDKSIDWAIYYHDGNWQDGKCYTEYTFPFIDQAKGSNDVIAQIGMWGESPNTATGFYKRAMQSQLPAFTYIEPKWGYGAYGYKKQGNDYHPPTDIRPAEQLLYDLIYALMYNQEKWEKTLFIITFDEHGGTYDHHSPTWDAVNPNVPNSAQPDFNFELYGVRVPTILLSPYITHGTVFRSEGNKPYDHTSLIATILKWKGIDPATVGMGNRVKVAPTFENVLNSTVVKGWTVADLPKPLGEGPSIYDPSPIDEIIEGLPTAIARCLTENSSSLEHLESMVKSYKATGVIPKEMFSPLRNA